MENITEFQREDPQIDSKIESQIMRPDANKLHGK